MVWPFGGSKEVERVQADETSAALASIFAPKHAVLSNSSTSSLASGVAVEGGGDKKAKASRKVDAVSAQWNVDTHAVDDDGNDALGGAQEVRSSAITGDAAAKKRWWLYGSGKSLAIAKEAGAGSAGADTTATSASSRPPKQPEGLAVTIDTLPPCPIAGYTLDTKKGVIDTLVKPPHPLSAAEVRAVIVELSGLEQSAKYTLDSTFASQMGGRSLRALELFVSPCLFLVGLYLMTYKTAKLYTDALPRQSFLLNHLASIVQSASHASAKLGLGRRAAGGPLTAERKEKFAQRHRRFMQAANTRVTLTFLSGVFMFSVAFVTRPGLDVIENNPEVNLGKQMVGYQQHSEASLKWMWFVYYHHPAYSKEAQSILAPPLAR